MNRQIKVYIGDSQRLVGTLFFNASGHRVADLSIVLNG